MNNPHITVVGSYATGLTMRVDRLPTTGETLLGTGYRVDYGGKGSNQAVGCARLGAKVSFVSKIGKDAFGEMALGLYRDEGVNVENVIQTTDAPTGVGFIVVETGSGKNCIVLDPGANEFLSADDVGKGSGAFKKANVVLTQLEIPVAAAEAAVAAGRRCRAMTILNPAPVRPLPAALLKMVDVLTPNETEAKVLVGRSPNETSQPEQLARELIAQGVKTVVMTLGERGALIVTASSSIHVPAIAVETVDTTGAGDAFNAGLATALAYGSTLQDAVRFAVVTGGLAVRKQGVIPSLPLRREVLGYYERGGTESPGWLKEHQPQTAQRTRRSRSKSK
ncbi:MAG TPA: ribokinase [Terriglobales bacterium]|nr:ribokinase [Terriglobales bacterium]